MRRILISSCLVVALVTGCGGGGEGTDPTTVRDTAGAESTAAPDTAPDATAADSTTPTDSAVPTTSGTPATEPPATEPPVTEPAVESPLEGVGPIAVESTGGERPRFSWDDVDDAKEYSLVVATSDGDVVWAWRGRDTSVDLGAGLIDGNEGPRITTDSVIDVFALAADGTIVAASGSVPISP